MMEQSRASGPPEMLDFEAFKEQYQKVPVEEYPNRVVETMPEPVVSVHVSTYQHADFIHDCMEGVLMQETDFPFEIIIGEDESDDGTREICKEYADKYPEKIRLFLHRRENNIAIHGQPTGRFQFTYSKFVARGEYVAICEGDDFWTDPKKLQKQIDLLEANKEYVLSHHDARIINASGEEQASSKLPDDNKRNFSQYALKKGPFLLTLSLCYRNLIDRYPTNFFSVLNADKFLISLLGGHGKGAYQGDVGPSVYREHGGGMWSAHSSTRQYKALADTFKQMEKYYRARGDYSTRMYYRERYTDCKERLCYLGIEEMDYKRAFSRCLNIVKEHTQTGSYYKAVYIMWSMLRFFTGHIRKLFCRKLIF